MRLPRPASPRALWADLKAFLGDRPKHQWIALGLALVIPFTIFIVFMFDIRNAHKVTPTIIYVQSWPADRSLEASRANIRAIAERNKAFREERRRQFQEIQNGMNRMGL